MVVPGIYGKSIASSPITSELRTAVIQGLTSVTAQFEITEVFFLESTSVTFRIPVLFQRVCLHKTIFHFLRCLCLTYCISDVFYDLVDCNEILYYYFLKVES